MTKFFPAMRAHCAIEYDLDLQVSVKQSYSPFVCWPILFWNLVFKQQLVSKATCTFVVTLSYERYTTKNLEKSWDSRTTIVRLFSIVQQHKNRKPVVDYFEHVRNTFPVARRVRPMFDIVCTSYVQSRDRYMTVARLLYDPLYLASFLQELKKDAPLFTTGARYRLSLWVHSLTRAGFLLCVLFASLCVFFDVMLYFTAIYREAIE